MTYAPISEAPRDGSPVLATWSPGVCCCTAIWDGVQWCEADTEHEFMPQPTHYLVGWSPLADENAAAREGFDFVAKKVKRNA